MAVEFNWFESLDEGRNPTDIAQLIQDATRKAALHLGERIDAPLNSNNPYSISHKTKDTELTLSAFRSSHKVLTWREWSNALTGISHFTQAYPMLSFNFFIMTLDDPKPLGFGGFFSTFGLSDDEDW